MVIYALAFVLRVDTFLALHGTTVMLNHVNICGYYRHDHLNLRRVGAGSPHQTVGSTEEVFMLVVVHIAMFHRTTSHIFSSHSGAEINVGQFFSKRNIL